MFGGIYRRRRVLVTGHTGFKGVWLAEWLLKLGADVAGFSVDVPTRPSLFEEARLRPRLARHYVGDIADFNAIGKAIEEFQPEIVFHLAAQAIVKVGYEHPRLTFQTNLCGMVNLLDAIRRSSSVKAAVLITSDKCYENEEQEHAYRESDRLGGHDPYSASKACAEIAFGAMCRSFFEDRKSARIATARAGNVVGGGDWAASRLVPDCVRAWSQGSRVVIRSPEATRPWQNVLDPLSGYLLLGAGLWGDSTGLHGEAFNFGPMGESVHPVKHIVDGMAETWPDGGSQVDGKGVVGREATLLSVCSEKAATRLGWQPTLEFDEAVKMTGQWYRDFYDGSQDALDLTRHQIKTYEQKGRERDRVWAAGGPR
jgi:CDP-glucose 4,6-dehydratase